MQLSGLLSVFAEMLAAQAPKAAKYCSTTVREVADNPEDPTPLVSYRCSYTLPPPIVQGTANPCSSAGFSFCSVAPDVFSQGLNELRARVKSSLCLLIKA